MGLGAQVSKSKRLALIDNPVDMSLFGGNLPPTPLVGNRGHATSCKWALLVNFVTCRVKLHVTGYASTGL